MGDNDSTRLATIGEVAKHLAIHRTTVYSLINRGDLPTVTVASDRRIPIVAVVEYASRLKWATTKTA